MTDTTNSINMSLPMLTLKGQITIHYIDGETLAGEFAAQDAFNIFILVEQEPLMIPRSQIRYIKGQTGQAIEPDNSHSLQAIEGADLSTIESQLTPVPTGSMWDTDISGLHLDSETEDADEGDDATVFFEEDDLLGDNEATILFDNEEEEEEEESTLVIDSDDNDDDDDDTLQLTAFLECTAGPHAGQRFHLQPGTTTIGRSNENVFALSSDKEVSRRHALITEQADGTFVAEDRNSLNGVIINDIRIENPQTLQEGDELLIGQCMLVFHYN